MRTIEPLFSTVTTLKPSVGQVQKQDIQFGRVLDIILDENHREYKSRGGLKSLNGVFYAEIGVTSPNSQESRTNFAYQANRHLQVVPKIGEIVILQVQPGTEVDIVDPIRDVYYTGIVNIWNHTKDNVSLDVRQSLDVNQLLQEEFEVGLIHNPVRSAQGDLHLQGRQGQSLRFTGALSKNSPYVDALSKDLPLTILRTGGPALDVPYQTLSEDITRDISSVYLTSNHIIPIKTVSEFTKSFKGSVIEATNTYRGEQVIVNTGRVVLNAKHDSILVAARESVAVSANTLNLESKDYIAVESPTIYLGRGALIANKPEPVLLGNKTERFLQGILEMIKGISADLIGAKTLEGQPIPLLNKRGTQLRPQLAQLERELLSIKSNKIYVE